MIRDIRKKYNSVSIVDYHKNPVLLEKKNKKKVGKLLRASSIAPNNTQQWGLQGIKGGEISLMSSLKMVIAGCCLILLLLLRRGALIKVLVEWSLHDGCKRTIYFNSKITQKNNVPDPLDRGTDPRIGIRIQIRTKMSRIRNTATNDLSLFALRFLFLQTQATSYSFCKGERRKTW